MTGRGWEKTKEIKYLRTKGIQKQNHRKKEGQSEKH